MSGTGNRTLTFSAGLTVGDELRVLHIGFKPTTTIFADNTVTNAKMADNAIDSAEIVAGAVDLAHLSATGTPSASVVLKGDNSWGTIEGSEITTVGTTFSNYNTISGNTTTTTASTKNMFLLGQISVNDTYTWTIAGDGELTII